MTVMDRILERPDADTLLALADRWSYPARPVSSRDVDFAALMAAHIAQTSGVGSAEHRSACGVLADVRDQVQS